MRIRQCAKRPAQIPKILKKFSTAKTVEKKKIGSNSVKEAMGKIIEQVISTIIFILDGR